MQDNPEKKKLTVEDLISSQEETQRLLNAILWEIQDERKPTKWPTIAISVLGLGISLLPLVAVFSQVASEQGQPSSGAAYWFALAVIFLGALLLIRKR